MILICSLSFAEARAYAQDHKLEPRAWTWVSEPEILLDYPDATVVRMPLWNVRENAADIQTTLLRALEAGLVKGVVDA
jgi:hypothetical protein